MKVLNIETKEECYEVMKLMHAEAVRPSEKLVRTVVVNRFDNLPMELKALIKSYVPPNPIIKALKEAFGPGSYLRSLKLQARNVRLDEKRKHRYAWFLSKHPIDYVIKNLRKLEEKRKDEVDAQRTLSVMNQGIAKANASREQKETFSRTHYYDERTYQWRYKGEPWKPSGTCLLSF